MNSAAAARLRSGWRSGWLLVALITLGAALLRLIDLSAVEPDPFYDAAVRSMTLSWHNFFFGAFEPGGSVSIDKPPLDLWLQVISVKLLGFNSTTLKLPEALAGTAAVPLLFATVRRVFGTRAGVAASLALAVLPVDVITARSDTMDAVMMMLTVLALLLTVRACETGRTVWLLAALAALGLAFNVKLLESIVALPGITVIAYLGLPHTRRRRLLMLLGAYAVYVAVALSWLTATLLTPAHDRPFAIGSTDGSAWNAAFVFNGLDRVKGDQVKSQQPGFQQARHYPTATEAQRNHIPITGPSATRLLDRVGPLSGERLGFQVLAALLLSLPLLVIGLRRRRHSAPARAPGEPDPRVRWAVTVGLALWLLTGIVLFSHMARLHPRYTEGFTPAVAALLGIGAARASSLKPRLHTLALTLIVLLVYAEHLLFGGPFIWWLSLLAALAALLAAALARVLSMLAPSWVALATGATLALTLVALLAIPVRASVFAISSHVSDAGLVGALPPRELDALSSYLRSHQGTARYEVAAASATKVASLIVRDARPVVVLTSYNAQPLTSVTALRRLVATGAVRYAFLDTVCGRHTPRSDAACTAAATWVHDHGIDVSSRAGMPRAQVLWKLPVPVGSKIHGERRRTTHITENPGGRRRGRAARDAHPVLRARRARRQRGRFRRAGARRHTGRAVQRRAARRRARIRAERLRRLSHSTRASQHGADHHAHRIRH
jgi:4-amino-4-deoxy-L-arabinose transferase-like glycosyltransferase